MIHECFWESIFLIRTELFAAFVRSSRGSQAIEEEEMVIANSVRGYLRVQELSIAPSPSSLHSIVDYDRQEGAHS